LLYLILINDFPNHLNDHKVVLFADDTTITTRGKSLEEVMDVSHDVQSEALRWFSNDKLVVNKNKSVEMLFSLRKIDRDSIKEYSETTRFLGLQVDDRLLWTYHGNAIAEVISKNNYLIRNLVRHVTQPTLKLAYFGLIHSMLSYGLLVWG